MINIAFRSSVEFQLWSISFRGMGIIGLQLDWVQPEPFLDQSGPGAGLGWCFQSFRLSLGWERPNTISFQFELWARLQLADTMRTFCE